MHSFDLKLDRAEEHILEVERGVRAYLNAEPISLQTIAPHTIVINFADVPAQLAVVVGDVIFNLRSGLDHLAASLVPRKYRRDTMFPIFFEGVWEPGPDDESESRKKARARWSTTTRHMNPAAVELLKQLQPEDRTHWPPGELPALWRLNRLANLDKHSDLVVVGGAATGLEVRAHDARGNWFSTRVRGWDEPQAVGQGAALKLPSNAVGAEVSGGAVVLLMFDDVGGVPIPDGLRDPLLTGSRRVADALRPYVEL